MSSKLTGLIIGCAIDVHRELGPGLLESVYEKCLVYELQQKGIVVETQVAVPIQYKNLSFDNGYRIDLKVDNKVIVELKSVEKVLPIHKAQLMSYLKMSNIKLGLLINFNRTKLVEGISRLVV